MFGYFFLTNAKKTDNFGNKIEYIRLIFKEKVENFYGVA